MSRTKRSANLEGRSARLKLEPEKRHQTPINPGQYLAYRRPASEAAGSWYARFVDPDSKHEAQEKLGTADDYSDADGLKLLNYIQAQDKAKEWFKLQTRTARRIAGGEEITEGPMTVAQCMDEYFLEAHRRGVKGIKQALCNSRVWITPTLGTIQVDKLTQGRLKTWLQMVAESPAMKRSKAESPAAYRPLVTPEDFRKRKDSANRVLNLLLAALNQALGLRRVACDGSEWKAIKPYEGVRKPRIRFLTVPDQSRLVNACEGDFQKLVRAALFTGARASELARLLIMDFNPTSGTVFIAESKSGKSRHIVLTEEGQAFFTAISAGKGATAPLLNRTGVSRTHRVGRDDYWEDGDQCRPIKDACKAAGIDPIVFHELRHSYASALVNAGVPLVYVANQLGHADTSQVEQTYGHLAPTDVAATIRRLAPKLGIFDSANVTPLQIAAPA